MEYCIVCNRETIKVCSRCKITRYCSRKCQKISWSKHKVNCLPYVKLPYHNSELEKERQILAEKEKEYRELFGDYYK
jgi:hypothetical protein